MAVAAVGLMAAAPAAEARADDASCKTYCMTGKLSYCYTRYSAAECDVAWYPGCLLGCGMAT